MATNGSHHVTPTPRIRGEPDAGEPARPVRKSGPGKQTDRKADTAPRPDSYHVDPFRTGGRTDLSRLAPLCRHHHGVSHRRHWTMTATADGWFRWQTPNGQILWSQRHGRIRRDEPPPAAAAA